jgi:hypothetical protein
MIILEIITRVGTFATIERRKLFLILNRNKGELLVGMS